MAYLLIILLTVLTGLADTEGAHDNLVTLDELEKYIATTVPAYAQQNITANKTPFYAVMTAKRK
jgi:hypothetical protein